MSSEIRRLPPLLRRAWYSLNQAFRQRITHLELTPDQFSILRWLHEGDAQGLTQRTITDLMSSDPNTIASTLQRMEKAGLISRHEHEKDKRANRVRLEKAGSRMFHSAKKIAIELQGQILEALPVERQKKFLEELEIIAQACIEATSRLDTAKAGRKTKPTS